MKVADLSVEEFESLIHKVMEEEMEDLYFALDPNIRSKIEEGLKDIEEGKLTSLDDLIAQRKTSSGKI
ncbi:MAG: hypothetical protein A2042_05055 [Candidatus Schekmanbacteria bacterium GWA2_38_11]|uniref:Uncharacterized protein n=1 Tax=Candidatus Schekmanbacteria bacterium GWA2_38_11 TaxID=1817876 RepID=A0A1F7RJL3_9BACT|nr:MAG: hypothetical protein A2042_05055 [Candidatus Schekmanbacteria bacterium GWA2_38_11]